MDMDTAELRDVPLFAGLSDEDLARVATWLEIVDVPPDWHLLNIGSQSEGFFVVLQGRVSVRRDGVEVATLGPGQFFGEMGLLQDEQRNATVVTATETRAAVMDAAGFASMCEELPVIGERIQEAAAKRGG